MVNEHVRPAGKPERGPKIDMNAVEQLMRDTPKDDVVQGPVAKPAATPDATSDAEPAKAPVAERKDDPGINITDEKASRIQQVVDNHTRDALAELTILRDRADSLMHTLRTEDMNVKEVIHTYARKVAKVVKAGELIGRAIDEIEREFKPVTTTTITQQRS